jgi:hypothetical protein
VFPRSPKQSAQILESPMTQQAKQRMYDFAAGFLAAELACMTLFYSFFCSWRGTRLGVCSSEAEREPVKFWVAGSIPAMPSKVLQFRDSLEWLRRRTDTKHLLTRVFKLIRNKASSILALGASITNSVW